jgi:hypothetical protein
MLGIPGYGIPPVATAAKFWFTCSAGASALVAKDADRRAGDLIMERGFVVKLSEGSVRRDLGTELLNEREVCRKMSRRRGAAVRKDVDGNIAVIIPKSYNELNVFAV